MKQKPIVLWILFILPILFTAGCWPTTQTPITPTSTNIPPSPAPTNTPFAQTNDGIIVGANSTCMDRADFGYITENIPAQNALISSPTLFRWYYFAAEGAAPDWANVCVPTSFTLYLAAAPDYNITNTYTITPTLAENLTNILMFSFNLSDILQPHTSYRWMIVGHGNGITIGDDRLPLFQDESAWKLTLNSSQMNGQFQTGPACDLQTIGPINLLQPLDQAVLDTDTPFFQWDMPNCSATAYWLSFDTDPQMGSIDIGWVMGQEGFLTFQGSLQPCIVYNWQVKAGLYSTSYHLQLGNWSAISEIRSFIIRSTACPNAIAVATETPIPSPTATYVPRPTATSPPPTSTPVNCGDYKTEELCDVHGTVCQWVTSPTHGGVCVAK